MLSSKRLLELARKWKKVASLRSSSSSRASVGSNYEACGVPVADKGHFIVYSSEGKRFMVPLVYLKSEVFRELFKASEDEFGLPGDGPIIFPCDAVFMECVISSLGRGMSKILERALVNRIVAGRCCLASSLLLESKGQQKLVVYGF